ncbi:MAG: oxygen-independent coproporphyrinogen III oxidase [Candidatus Omnitrophota bacterium]
MTLLIDKRTIEKFDIPGPRYTSYPTAPAWSDEVNPSVYRERLRAFGASGKTLSLYIHIPFCETMCTYCACSVILRKNDPKYGEEYLSYLFRELDLITRAIGTRKKIRQFHWGGGTPTFLNEDQISRLFEKVSRNFEIDYDGEIAIEIDPRTIDRPKVKRLKELGFNRISMGIQDFDETVQRAVNRIQPYGLVKDFYDYCRELGFPSVNFDLIYGLPFQSTKSFSDTVRRVTEFRPDRIALYSFAYVPWLKKHQTKMDQASLPGADEKVDIFLQARAQLLEAGYQAIAMDHFALKDDELAVAYRDDRLYRNFMGYTVKPADEYIGAGVSSIGFIEDAFIQNHKVLKDYYGALDRDELPVERGKCLSKDDKIRQFTINSLMCHFKLDKPEFQKRFGQSFDEYFDEERAHIQNCLQDGLIEADNRVIRVSDLGKIFIRNICMGFDFYLRKQKLNARFSRTV